LFESEYLWYQKAVILACDNERSAQIGAIENRFPAHHSEKKKDSGQAGMTSKHEARFFA